MKHKHGTGNTYTPGWPMRLFILAIGLFIAGTHASILRTSGLDGSTGFPPFFFLLILFIDAFFLWYAIIFTTQTRVIASADGIELQRGGARLFAAWENISHFGIRGGGKNQQRGLYLYNKVQPDVTGLADRLFYGRATDFIPIGQVVNLPLFGFFRQKVDLDKLAETDFGRDVLHHAPHLLTGAKPKLKSDFHRLSKHSADTSYFSGSDSRTQRKQK